MADYAKMKVDELKSILKERGLPVTGKKDDLVARLTEHDSTQAAAAPVDATPATADEIQWDDDVETAKAATTEPAAAAVAAGGQGQPPNPQAVPNQQAATDPATTDDLSAQAPGDEAANKDTKDAAAAGEAVVPAEATEPAKPEVDFSRGLAATSLDEEIEKRRARARKFGLDEGEALKSLERAKKFGASGDAVKGMDEALPGENRKRRRDHDDNGGRRGQHKRRGGGREQNRERTGGPGNNAAPASGKGNWMSDKDRAAAEARKARFAAAS